MNKKALINLSIWSAIVFVALLVVVLIFSSVLSSAAVREVYQLGEPVKIDLRNIQEYEVKIITPSRTYFKRGSEDISVFRPREVGQHKIIVSSDTGILEEYAFIVETIVEKKQVADEIVAIDEEDLFEEKIEDEPVFNQTYSEKQIVINKPVSWKINKTFVAGGGQEISIPEQSYNISAYLIDGKKRAEVRVNTNRPLVSNFLSRITRSEQKVNLAFENLEGTVEVQYQTPGPVYYEEQISKAKKAVRVSSDIHYENVMAYTELAELTSNENDIRVYWKEEKRYLAFEAFDRDNDGLYDFIQWEIPHLSDQNFEIIIITDAQHLDEDREFVENIFEYVRAQDNNWTEPIPRNHFVRVRFERNLSFKNDITLYARSDRGARINIYEENGDEVIAQFNSVEAEGWYKVFLDGLEGTQDTFDLEVVGGEIEFDYIVDPVTEAFHESFPNSDTGWTGSDDGDTAQDEWWNITQEPGDITSMLVTSDLSRQGGSFGAEPSDPFFLKVSECDPANFGANCHAEARYSGGAHWNPQQEGWIAGNLSFYWAYYVDNNEGLRLQYWNGTSQSWVTIWTQLAGGQNTFQDWRQENFTIPSWVFEQTEFSFRLSFDAPGGQDDILIDEVVLNLTRRPPTVNVTSPMNTTYDVSSLNFTVILDKNGSEVWYTLTGGATNISLSSTDDRNYNATNSSIPDGSYTAQFYANDTFGNLNDSQIITFLIDTTPPDLVIIDPDDAVNYTSATQIVNVSTSDATSSVAYTALDINNDLLLYMRMDDINASGDPTDISSYSFNGTANGSSSQTPSGRAGDGFNVDGVSQDYIDLGTRQLGYNEFTLALWFNWTDDDSCDNGFDLIFSKDGVSDFVGGIDCTGGDEGDIIYLVTNTSGSGSGAIRSTVPITAGIFYHIAIIANGTDTALYVNGTLDSGTITSFTGGVQDDVAPFYLGKETNDIRFFNGTIDEVFVYNRSLNLAEIVSLYNDTQYDETKVFEDGSHTIRAYSSDRLGNLNDSESVAFNIDTTPPTAVIDSPVQDQNYSFDLLDLNFSVNDNFAGIDSCWYTLDGGTTNVSISGCNNLTFTADQGNNTLQFYVNDSYGNVNATENVSFFVDSVIPLISFVPPTVLNGSGSEFTFIFVNVSITEANFANITYELYNITGGNQFLNRTTYTTLVTTINWTNLDNNFMNYTYNVTIVDILGNTNSTETRTITLTPGDINPPDIFFDSPSAEGFFYDSSSVFFQVSLSEAGSLVWYQINDSNTNYSMQSTDDITWNATNGSIADGAYEIIVFANDTVGNQGSRSRNFTVDTTFPLIDYGIGTENDGINISRNWVYVNVSVVEINELRVNFSLYNDGGLVNHTSYSAGTRTINWTSLADDDYTYNVSVTDLAGNINTTTTREIRLDTTTPQATLLSPVDAALLNSLTQNLTVNASDNLGLFNLTLFVYNITNDLINQTTINNYDANIRFGIVYVFPEDGNYSWGYRVTDTANNVNITVNHTLGIDTSAPLINFTNPTLANGTEIEQNYIFINLSLVEPNFANITYELHNTGGLVNRTVYTTPVTTINWTNLPSNNVTYFFNATTYDNFGNVNSTETRQVDLIDISGPLVNIVLPEEITYTTNTSLALNYTVSDLSALDSCWWNIDNGANMTITCGQNTTFNSTDGVHTITVYSNDSLNNIGSDSVTFSISTAGPAVTLITPVDWANLSTLGEILFNYTAVDPDSVDSCTLYGNWTGTWHANQTDTFDWWHTSYVYRKEINISSVAGSQLIDFPIYLNVSAEAEMRADYRDLRFVNGSCGGTSNLELDYEIESYDSVSANTWVRIPAFETGTNTICLYYGNSQATDAQDPVTVWNNSYDAVYHLNHTSGNAIDSSGESSCTVGSCDAEENFAPDSNMNVSGIVGRGDYFDGSDYLGENPEWDADANDGADHTYCAWVKFTESHDGTILEDGGNSQGSGIGVLVGGNFRIGETNGGLNNADSPLAYNDNQWHHVCGVCTSASALELYVDGELVATDTTGVNCAVGGGDARIGQGNGGNPVWDASLVNPINATMDEIRVSTNERNVDWINQSYQIIADQSGLVTVGGEEDFLPQTTFTTNITAEGYHSWNVLCNDTNGFDAFAFSNFTFALFLFPNRTTLLSANQTVNDGTGNITMFWNSVGNAVQYRVYYNESLSGNFSLLGQTTALNFTDDSFNSTVRRFYRIDTWNPTGQNESTQYFGAHVYTLRHSGNTRNWIGFPSNASYLRTANQTLREVRNATAFTYWNETYQGRVTCNEFSCPNFPSCTDTNCNFGLDAGRGYEVNINSSAPSVLNWSLIGIVYDVQTIALIQNLTDFGKNWIAFYANTSIVNASGLIESIDSADAVTNWDASAQTSQGLIYNFFGSGFLGTNFNIIMEKGYEVSVNASINWTQS